MLVIAVGVNAATTTVTYQVSVGADDSFAQSAAVQDTTAAYLKIGDEHTYAVPYQMSAMRFNNVNIPRSATITSAYLKITSINTDYRGRIYGVIAAEASDNPTDFSGRMIGNAALTTATVAWDFKDAWSPDTQYISPDISNVLQEVVNRSGFGSGNSMAIYYSTRDLSGKARSFASYEYSPASAAVLEVTYETYTISGHILTTEAAPLEGVAVSAGVDIEGDVTDASGYYELKVPLGWSGTVTPSKADWGFTPASQSYSNVTSNKINQDYTAFQPVISGYVKDGIGTGIEGVSVSADNGGGSDTTDAAGYYELKVPLGWSGTVTPSKADWGFAPANQTYSSVSNNQSNQNYTAFQPVISGYVKDGTGTGIEGVSVSADNGGGSDTTDATGYYEIVVPYNWSGSISANLAGYHFTDKSYTNVITDQTNQNFTGYQPTISGYVKKADGTGLEGVAVTADNGGGADLTDLNGYYELIVPYDWSGTVTVSKADWGFTEFSKTYQHVVTDLTEQYYTAFQPVISGTIYNAFGTALPGVTLSLNDSSADYTTGSDGSYEFVVPHNWSGSVIPDMNDYVFAPNYRTYSNVRANQPNQNYTGNHPLIISGHVYNGQGQGIPGVTISDDQGVLTTITDPNGYYELTVYYSWTGTIKATHPSMAFEPEISITNIALDMSSQDFNETIRIFTRTWKIISRYDDAYSTRWPSGYETTNVSSSTLKVGHDRFYDTDMTCGLRFQSFDVTKQAVIVDAYLTLIRAANVPIYEYIRTRGERNADAPQFSSNGSSLWSRSRTYSSKTWGWTGGSAGTPQVIPKLEQIVEEVTFLPDWSPGNAIVFLLDPYYTDDYSSPYVFYAYGTSKEATLTVTYQYAPRISGRVVTSQGQPLPDVQVMADNGGGTGLTDPQGYYELNAPPGWSGTVTPSKGFWIFESPQRDYQNVYSDKTGQDFVGTPPVTISGYVSDVNDVAVAEVLISAGNGGGTGVTGSDGYYEIEVPYNWTGAVTVSKPFWFFEPDSIMYSNVTVPLTDQNYQAIAGYIISGYIQTQAGTSLERVDLEANNGGQSAITNAEGYYEVAVLPEWSGTITPAKTGRVFIPEAILLDNVNEDRLENNFVSPNQLHVDLDGGWVFSTIQEAIEAAVDGDEVIVHPGRYMAYNGYIDYMGKAITVRSVDPTDPEVVASTILDGCRIYFYQGEGRDSVLNGLTLNGSVYCYHSSPVIKNCVFFTTAVHGYQEGNSAIVIHDNRNTAGNTTIENCLFSLKYAYPYGHTSAILVQDGQADIVNTTIAYCVSEIDDSFPYTSTATGLFISQSDVSLRNSIIWGNRGSDDVQIAIQNNSSNFNDPFNSRVYVAYCDIEGEKENILIFPNYSAFDNYWQNGILPDPNLIDPDTLMWASGNVDVDPCFAQPGFWDPNGTPGDANDDFWVDGDYHLQSEAGRWDPNQNLWLTDANTSDCLDAGDPNSDWTGELWPHGKRINMGAYGGTPEASMSLSTVGNEADLNNDGFVNTEDLALFVEMWVVEEVLLSEDINRNGLVNFSDWAEFAEQWLWEE